jgi:hypothetical protein
MFIKGVIPAGTVIERLPIFRMCSRINYTKSQDLAAGIVSEPRRITLKFAVLVLKVFMQNDGDFMGVIMLYNGLYTNCNT